MILKVSNSVTTDANPGESAGGIITENGRIDAMGHGRPVGLFWGTAYTDIEQFAIPRTLNEINIMKTYVRSEERLKILAFIGSVAQVPEGKTVPECRGDF